MSKVTTKSKLLVNIKSRTMLPQLTDVQFEAVANSVGLTSPELKEIHHLAYATYQYIGADLAQCRADMDEPAEASREEIVEVVLDANYLEQANHGKITPKIKDWLLTKSTKYDLDVVYAAVAVAFPFPRYE